MRTRSLAAVLTLVAGTASAQEATSISLPGGPSISMDYLAYDNVNERVWVPAGNTGNVVVIDAVSGKQTTISGFETTSVKGRDGKERKVGPSSASAGDGFVFVGTRAGSQVCAVDAKSLERKGCLTLPSSPDGTAYVETTRELWITTPRDNSITVVDAKSPSALKVVGKVAAEGPEGYAVDTDRGVFYTNLEEKDRTLAIDVKSRKQIAEWNAQCGKEGPRGLALDAERRQVFVACAAGKVNAFDAEKGTLLGQAEAGAGLDNIDYLPRLHRIYAAGGRAGTLTVIEADAKGALRVVRQVPAAEGGRVVVVDSRGAAYVADSKGGRVVVVHP
jgi:DNA-binding beta-propeller fold protein YncE